jgi:nucleoside-diphosphate-sugar epimerase
LVTKVLVNRGTGFIGSHLMEALTDEGCQVRVLDSLQIFPKGSQTKVYGARRQGAIPESVCRCT